MASARTAPDTPSLAPAPRGDWWDNTQWAVLLSLLDAVLAPVVAAGDDARASAPAASTTAYADGLAFDRTSVKTLPRAQLDAAVARTRAAIARPPHAALVADLLAERPSDNPQFLQCARCILSGLPSETTKGLGGLLTLLSGRTGALLLTGYPTPVHTLPVHAREAILQSWSRSWIPTLRTVVLSFRALAHTSWAMSSSMFRQVSGFTDVPPDWRAGPGHDFKFEQFDRHGDSYTDSHALQTVETDVVIVGSGCGGAVCAQVLAAAGHQVTVVEKGYHFAQEQLPMPQIEGSRLLFENGGVAASANPSISVLAGACWGGGGTINWSVCLKTPDRVRQEWAAKDEPGMSFLTSPAYDESMDRVCDFMGINNQRAHIPDSVSEIDDRQSHRGRVILDGAVKLGFKAESLLQNTKGGEPHNDGYCHLGCATAEKQGTSVTWLPSAARAGAKFVEGFHVERVLFDDEDGTSHGPAGPPGTKATGVVGTWLSRDARGGVAGPASERHERRVVIKAKKVIVSGGSLWSPVVLLKSGLTNPHIGKNLHLHPCTLVSAFFDEETKPMDNGIITSMCTSFEDLDGEYHGPRIQSVAMVPYLVMPGMPWHNSLDVKLAAARYRHMDAFIALTRDRDTGRVFPDPATGKPVVDYTPSALDREHAAEGAIGIARLCHARGANEIRTYVAGTRSYVRSKDSKGGASAADTEDADTEDAGFEAWVKDVRRAANSASCFWGGWNVASPFASAHQMGTCRMGDDGGTASVVDPRGRVWGTDGLYVADASVFPSASGVNPMVTTMALADWIARGIAAELSSG